MAIQNTRWKCNHCKAEGWSTPSLDGSKDHVRPDGRRCLASARVSSLATDIDLAPRGATIIDLGGRLTLEQWSPWGSSYGSRMEDWTPEKGAAAKALSEATETRLRKATKTEIKAYVLALRPTLFLTRGENRKDALVTIALNEINARRYPNKFVNAKGEI